MGKVSKWTTAYDDVAFRSFCKLIYWTTLKIVVETILERKYVKIEKDLEEVKRMAANRGNPNVVAI